MTSREIIINLIDNKIINGEQAFTLINDLLKAELLEAWETLNSSKENSKSDLTTDFNRIWVSSNPYTISGSSYATNNSETAGLAITDSNITTYNSGA